MGKQKQVIVLRDKYKSTVPVYPKIIDECLPTETLGKIEKATKVEANPTLAGTESDLTGLKIEDTAYKIPTPTTVVANPTLAGTEADLEGLQVGDTKYKISSGGGDLYWQQYQCHQSSDGSNPGYSFVFQIFTKEELNLSSKADLLNFLKSNNLTNTAPRLEVLYGEITQDEGTTWRQIEGIRTSSAGSTLYVVCPKHSVTGQNSAYIQREEISLTYCAISRMFSIKIL